jgi:sirohydrochlorin cobaltochelatase
MSVPATVHVVLVGGHESVQGCDLVRFARQHPDAVAVGTGRRLHDAVEAALEVGKTVVVVPMTLGRDPTLVATVAKTLQWLARTRRGAVALAAPFGVRDHLTAYLRAAARTVASRDPGGALVIVARSSNPFDDADLHRVAHLVRVYGSGLEVAPAIVDNDTEPAGTFMRLRRLGFARSVVATAGFAAEVPPRWLQSDDLEVTPYGPLLSDTAVGRIVADRASAAAYSLTEGCDGIDIGLSADHGHGYAHSHATAAAVTTAPDAHHHHHTGQVSAPAPTTSGPPALHRRGHVFLATGPPSVSSTTTRPAPGTDAEG